MNSAISISNVSRSFGDLKALDGVSLRIGKGELFGLLGPNGAGKTTMIKILTGQLRPGSGDVSVLGRNVLDDPVKIREIIGIVPEQETPPSFLSAEEYLHFVARIRKLDGRRRRRRYGSGGTGGTGSASTSVPTREPASRPSPGEVVPKITPPWPSVTPGS